MFIDVRIPYDFQGRVGTAYNREMQTVKDWVLFFDHDVFISTNPHWYDMCLDAIKQVGHEAGWITGVTNRIGCSAQKAETWGASIDLENDDYLQHVKYARMLWEKHGNKLVSANNHEFSGFFILTHKKAWNAVGGVADKMFVDRQYSRAIVKAGYQQYVMPGLYFYHLHKKKQEVWQW